MLKPCCLSTSNDGFQRGVRALRSWLAGFVIALIGFGVAQSGNGEESSPGEVFPLPGAVWNTSPDQPWTGCTSTAGVEGIYGSSSSLQPPSWLEVTLNGPGKLQFSVDTGLTLPDFRAAERTYQLLSQVAGRAGRGERPGKVLIQTYRAKALAITAATNHDYLGFYQGEVAARADLGYPPHGRLIAIRLDGADPNQVIDTAQRLALLAQAVGKRIGGVDVAGPVAAPLEKLRGRVRWQIWLRGPRRQDVRQVARSVLTADIPSAVRVSLDVDPVSTM